MLKTAASLGSALLLIVIPIHPLPADWISGDELNTSCDALLTSDDRQAGLLCRAFVHGYLVGATRPKDAGRKGEAAAPVRKGEESYRDRAVRTRVNPKLLERVESEAVPEYCLGESTGLTDVARVLALQLESDRESAEIPDGKAVRRALAREFPCDA